MGWRTREGIGVREKERNEIKTALARPKATGRSRFPQFTTADVRRARASTSVDEYTTRLWWRPFPFSLQHGYTHAQYSLGRNAAVMG